MSKEPVFSLTIDKSMLLKAVAQHNPPAPPSKKNQTHSNMIFVAATNGLFIYHDRPMADLTTYGFIRREIIHEIRTDLEEHIFGYDGGLDFEIEEDDDEEDELIAPDLERGEIHAVFLVHGGSMKSILEAIPDPVVELYFNDEKDNILKFLGRTKEMHKSRGKAKMALTSFESYVADKEDLDAEDFSILLFSDVTVEPLNMDLWLSIEYLDDQGFVALKSRDIRGLVPNVSISAREYNLKFSRHSPKSKKVKLELITIVNDDTNITENFEFDILDGDFGKLTDMSTNIIIQQDDMKEFLKSVSDSHGIVYLREKAEDNAIGEMTTTPLIALGKGFKHDKLPISNFDELDPTENYYYIFASTYPDLFVPDMGDEYEEYDDSK
jgi:hypothetical protein